MQGRACKVCSTFAFPPRPNRARGKCDLMRLHEKTKKKNKTNGHRAHFPRRRARFCIGCLYALSTQLRHADARRGTCGLCKGFALAARPVGLPGPLHTDPRIAEYPRLTSHIVCLQLPDVSSAWPPSGYSDLLGRLSCFCFQERSKY
uniref:Uncharacterized protein n=1 Tax=Mus musculus TaxID=10090 RepID=Q3UY66_MOUSE|nr:unnamed protein product [Mus musculus]